MQPFAFELGNEKAFQVVDLEGFLYPVALNGRDFTNPVTR